MKVLSLFDGMSCGRIALERAGKKVDAYYASEIDKYAMKVSQANYPDIIQLGDVRNVFAKDLPKIDLLIGGSPCQGFSFAGKGLNFEDERSKLFFEYLRIWNEIKESNPNAKFLLENVRMKKEYEIIISKYLGVSPIFINSNLVSAQNRDRIYWTNINEEPYGLFGDMYCSIPQPQDKGILLKDILEDNVDSKYILSEKRIAYFKRKIEKKFLQKIESDINGKSECLLATMYKQMQGFCVAMRGRSGNQEFEIQSTGKSNSMTTVQKDNMVIADTNVRRYTAVECERLQTVPDNYTNHVSDSQRYKMLGNGWTVDIIAHIFKYL